MQRTDIYARCVATQETRDAFEGRSFAYGKADCLMMVHSHLRRFGYQVPDLPPYRGSTGAKKALEGQGAKTLIELVSRYLEPIPPAFMLPGDILAGEGKPFDSLAIHSGQLLFGWCEGEPKLVNFGIDANGVQRAWRVQFQDIV